jgi:hypothetical protein
MSRGHLKSTWLRLMKKKREAAHKTVQAGRMMTLLITLLHRQARQIESQISIKKMGPSVLYELRQKDNVSTHLDKILGI